MILQEICCCFGHMEVFYKLVICILRKYIQRFINVYSGDYHHGKCNVFNYGVAWYCHVTYLWCRHMGWNLNVDGTMLSIIKSRKWHILGSWWWSVPRYLWCYEYFLFIFMVPIVLLCFRWVHFLWCGYVCMGVLMDVNQGSRRDKENKRRSC